MSDKTLRIALILLALVIVIIIVLAVVYNNSSQETPYVPVQTTSGVTETKIEKNKDEEKIEQKYKPSSIDSQYRKLTNEDKLAIDEEIDYILSLINTHEITYKMLPLRYKQAKFPNEDDFEKYMEENFPGNDYKATSYRVTKSAMYVSIQNEDKMTTLKVMNYKKGKDKIKVYFDDITEVARAVTNNSFENVTIYGEYMIKYADKLGFVVQIVNNRSSEVTINFDGTTIEDADPVQARVAKTIGENVVTVPAKAIKNFEITFTGLKREANRILYNLDINGNNYDTKDYIGYYGEDDDE